MKNKELENLLGNISLWYPINVLEEGTNSQRKHFAIFDIKNHWQCKLEIIISNTGHKINLYAKVNNDQRAWKDCIHPVILEELNVYDFVADLYNHPYRMEYEYYNVSDLMPYWIWRIKKFFNRNTY